MTSAPRGHPAPHGDKLSTRAAFFILFGGPVAWLVQLVGSVALLGWPCFPTTDRFPMPIAHYGWTRAAAVVLLCVCCGVALAAGIVGLAKFRKVRAETDGGKTDLIERGHGRTRFTALWGIILGFSFAVAILLSAVPIAMVTQCAG